MPNIKSAIKRVKTANKAHLRNISTKSAIKSNIKKLLTALAEKTEKDIEKYFKETVSSLDKAVNKGIITKGTASRKKSRLAKKIDTLIKSGQASESPKIKETIKAKEQQEKVETVKKTKKIPKAVQKKVKKTVQTSPEKVKKPKK